MMKSLIILAALVALAGVVLAGSVYDRATVTIPNAGASRGTASYEFDYPYSGGKLVRIWQHSWTASNNLTIARVTTEGYTNTVGTITDGNTVPRSTATFTAGYLKAGDKLTFVSNPTTGGVVYVEFEVQQR